MDSTSDMCLREIGRMDEQGFPAPYLVHVADCVLLSPQDKGAPLGQGQALAGSRPTLPQLPQALSAIRDSHAYLHKEAGGRGGGGVIV